MKRFFLFILLAISVSCTANAQWAPIAYRGAAILSRSSSKAMFSIAERTRQAERAAQYAARRAALVTERSVVNIRNVSPVVGTRSQSNTGRGVVSPSLPPHLFIPHVPPHLLTPHVLSPRVEQYLSLLRELNVRLQRGGFIPQKHNTAPAKNLLDNNELLQDVQRQETLSNKQDRLREKIYKSPNKLNSTERESTITGHNIYNNEYEYILDAA